MLQLCSQILNELLASRYSILAFYMLLNLDHHRLVNGRLLDLRPELLFKDHALLHDFFVYLEVVALTVDEHVIVLEIFNDAHCLLAKDRVLVYFCKI